MKTLKILFAAITFHCTVINGQSLYFPPLAGSTWETTSLKSLGWDSTKVDSLYSFLSANNTKAFIVLKNGRIVLEKYFGSFTQDSIWFWASAGKTITAVSIGLAKQENLLKLTDSTSKYLGSGWTSETPAKEGKITILNQLTMTSGLNDAVSDPYCTDSGCLQYIADAGSRWAYHNAPYTLLDKVINNASGQTLNAFIQTRLKNKTGMTGFYLQSGYNNIFYSTARSMARFGLMMLNYGKWDNTIVLSDTQYFNQMINTSQQINKSYGYLWWLNGKSSYMVPQSQIVFQGYLNPDAPADMFAALGKSGQLLNIVTSQNLILVRMGDAPDNSLVPWLLNNQIWQYLKKITQPATEVRNEVSKISSSAIQNFPNPFGQTTRITFNLAYQENIKLEIYNTLGIKAATLFDGIAQSGANQIEFNPAKYGLSSGVYYYVLTSSEGSRTGKLGYYK